MGVIGQLLSLFSGMLIRFGSHQQCFVFPWEPAKEQLVHTEAWAGTVCTQAL